MKNYFLFLLIFCLLYNYSFSQIECETTHEATYEHPIPDVFPGDAYTPITIRMYIHIGKDNNIPAIDETQIEELKNEINSKYNPWNISFNYCVDYFDCPCETTDLLILTQTFSQDDGLNLYISATPGYPNSNGIPSKNIFLKRALSKASHEIGHALGLLHTFHGTSPCAEASGDPEEAPYMENGQVIYPEINSTLGDYIRDTPADPYKEPFLKPNLGTNPPDTKGCFYYRALDSFGNFIFNNPDPTDPKYQDFSVYSRPFIDPLNVIQYNVMAYSRKNSESVFTQGQVDRMRNTIYYHPYMDNILDPFISTTEIAQDEVWNDNKSLKNDLYIKSGVHLQINSTIEFLPGKGIILEKGAELTLTGKLTKSNDLPSCESIPINDFWTGVTILPGIDPATGKKTTFNNYGTIEYAKKAISIRGNGEFKAASFMAQFINNERSLDAKFINISPRFINCNFTVDNNYLSPQYYNQIEVSNGLVYLSDCDFYDNTNNDWETDRNAIYASMSSMKYFGGREGIKNFKNGIYLASSLAGNQSVISNVPFYNNGVGVKTYGYHDVTITNCDFKINMGNSNFDSQDPDGKTYGINYDQAYGLVNRFNRFENASNQLNSIGIYLFRSSSDRGTLIRDNDFLKNNIGINTFSGNARTAFYCNDFYESGLYDLKVENGELKPTQGTADSPAGNKFSHTGPIDSDWSNIDGSGHITYHFNENILLEEPIYYSNLGKFGTDESADCPGKHENSTFEEVSLELDEKSIEFDTYIDNHDPNVITICKRRDIVPEIIVSLTEEIGPWLSEEAAVALLSNADLYTEQQLVRVITANPDLLNHISINKYYLGENSNFNPASKQSILNSIRSTLRGELQNEIYLLEIERDYKLNVILCDILFQEEIDYNAYRNYLHKNDVFSNKMAVTESYIKEGNFNAASSFYNNMLRSYDLSEPERNDVMNMIRLSNVLFPHYLSGEFDDQLNISDVNQLEVVANFIPGYAANKARAILNTYYDRDYEPLPFVPVSVQFPSFLVLHPRSSEDISTKINVIPNPNSGKFELEMISQNAENIFDFIIFDSFGKIVFTEKIHSGAYLKKSFDLSNLSKGFYFYELVNENEKLSGKMSIQ